MISPPKYTRTAQERPFYQHHNNNFIDDENNDIDAPPPAYSRQASRDLFTQDAQRSTESGSIRSDWSSVPPIPSHLQQAYPPRFHRLASHRRNPLVEDVRAWNAFQVLNLNSSSGRARTSNSRLVRTAPRHGDRSRDDVENDGFHDRPPMRSPKYGFCTSRGFVFAVLTLIVLVILIVAVAKGVAFFHNEKEKQTSPS